MNLHRCLGFESRGQELKSMVRDGFWNIILIKGVYRPCAYMVIIIVIVGEVFVVWLWVKSRPACARIRRDRELCAKELERGMRFDTERARPCSYWLIDESGPCASIACLTYHSHLHRGTSVCLKHHDVDHQRTSETHRHLLVLFLSLQANDLHAFILASCLLTAKLEFEV